MKTLTVAYTDRTCITGYALYKALKSSGRFRWVKRTFRRSFDSNTDVLLRWGCSDSFPLKVGALEINTRESVINASSKEKMLRILSGDETINTPKVLFLADGTPSSEVLDGYRKEGNFYVWGSDLKVRFTNTLKAGDIYVTKPIARSREFRVQVFNGNIIKMYEKVPNDPTQALMKSFNCQFKRVDPERFYQPALDMCIRGVQKLGLTCGGVDLIRNQTGKYFINEINSGFGLNTPNVLAYKDLIVDFVYRR